MISVSIYFYIEKMIQQSVVERKYGWDLERLASFDNKLHASRDVIRTFILLPKAAWTRTLFPFFFFISEEPAIVFVLFVLATSVSIAREITFFRDNKLISQEESCNWCSRRDEIDIDLSNKEYLAPRCKEKRGRENLSTFWRKGREYTSAMRFISVSN